MFENILTEIGFTKNEAKIYETLLLVGEATIGSISKRSHIHRRSVYDVVSRLMYKGLVYEVLTKKENTYRPVEPSKLAEITEEKAQKIKNELPKLQELFDEDPKEEAAYIYKGIEGFKNYMRDILSVGDDVYMIGAKGAWFDPRLCHFTKSFLKLVSSSSFSFSRLFDYEIKNKAPEIPETLGGAYKFLPKQYSTDSMITIFGDHIVSFNGTEVKCIDENVVVFVNINKPLADSYRTWFSFLWNHCYSKNIK